MLYNQRKVIFLAIFASLATILVVSVFAMGIFYWKGFNFNYSLSSSTRADNSYQLVAFGNQEEKIVNVVGQALPAVVSISVVKDISTTGRSYDSLNLQNRNEFNDHYYRQNDFEEKEVGGGSGFFVSNDGYIVTNRHVVEDEKAIYYVQTSDGSKYKATFVGSDPDLDVALIKIEGKNFPFLTFGDSNILKVGQSVIAIGNALAEFNNTVSVGVVSGLYRSIEAYNSFGQSEFLDEVIQTDAAINLGNSGGPLIDLSGKVIGINVAMAADSQNIGFALPANDVKESIFVIKNGF